MALLLSFIQFITLLTLLMIKKSVPINSYVSECSVASFDVPQGCFLGTLLFSIYIFSKCLKLFHFYCYVDDAQLYYSFPPCSVLILPIKIFLHSLIVIIKRQSLEKLLEEWLVCVYFNKFLDPYT